MHELAITQSVVAAVTERTGTAPVGGPGAGGPAGRRGARRDAVLLRARHGRDAARGGRTRESSSPRAGPGAGPAGPTSSWPTSSCSATAAARTSRCSRAASWRSRRWCWGTATDGLSAAGGVMCGTCGCGESDVRVEALGRRPRRRPARPLPRSTRTGSEVVDIEAALLAKNDHLAAHNRGWLAERGIVALNLMSSPGRARPRCCDRTIAELAPVRPIGVIEGDQETRLDAERIRAHRRAGRADQHRRRAATSTPTCWPGAWRSSRPPTASLVFVENVGNLVCPALFDLGERAQGRGRLGDRGRRTSR